MQDKTPNQKGNRQENDMKARFENFLDAKYNDYMDNTALRLAMIAVGFGAWLGASVTVLKLV